MAVYLIHFSRKYRHAGHYIGFARDVEARITEHRAGSGARLLQVIDEAGIAWNVERVWQKADRKFERSLKNKGHAASYCPLCRGAPRTRNAEGAMRTRRR